MQATSRILWGYAGYEDQLNVLQAATPVKANDTVFAKYVRPKIDSLVNLVKNQDAYGAQWRLDLSAEWQLSDHVQLTGMVQNLFYNGDNNRFDYISGLKGAAPRTDWVQEPRTFYVKLSSTF